MARLSKTPVQIQIDRLGGPVFVALLLVTAIACIQAYLNGLGAFWGFPDTVLQAGDEDLAAFYRASEMLARGRAAEAYDPDVFRAGLSEVNQRLLMLNPPHFFLLIKPLAYLSYGAVKAVFLTVLALGFVALARMSRSTWQMALLLVCSGGAYYTYTRLNISVLVISAIVFALINAEKRPWLAGMALALATVKPQYGLLVPFFLIAGGHWRAFWAACLATSVLLALSWWYLGTDVWTAFFASLQNEAYTAYAEVTAPGNLSVQSAVGKLGAAMWLRGVCQVLAIALGGTVIWHFSKRLTQQSLIGITLLASGLAAPSLMYYSWAIFCAGLCFLLAERHPWPTHLQAIAGLLWLQPIWATVLFNLYPQFAQSYSLLVTVNIALTLLLSIRLAASGRSPERQAKLV